MRKCLSVLRQFVNKINYSQTSHNFRSFRNFATKVNDSFAINFYRTKHPIFNRKICSLFFKLMGLLQPIPAAALHQQPYTDHHQHTSVSQAAALITARLSWGCTAASLPLWHLIIPQGEEIGKNTGQQSVCLMWNICWASPQSNTCEKFSPWESSPEETLQDLYAKSRAMKILVGPRWLASEAKGRWWQPDAEKGVCFDQISQAPLFLKQPHVQIHQFSSCDVIWSKYCSK